MKQGSLLSKALAFIVTALLIVVGLMFSAMLIAFIVVAGLVVFSWLWWKTRALRKLMREQAVDVAANDAEVFKGEVFEGEIIEGEVIRRVVSIEEIKR